LNKKELQSEAERARYSLRSSFFYRVHSLWPNLLQMLNSSQRLNIEWPDPHKLGISQKAWRQVKQQGISEVSAFCHPEVIKASPPLIAYYRCLALLPQKGLSRLAHSTKQLEDGVKSRITDSKAAKLAEVFNGLISLLIESDPKWSLEKSRIAALLNLGTQINGSWRNEIGAEGSRRVKELLVTYFAQAGLISDVVTTDGSQIKPQVILSEAEALPTEKIRSFSTKKGYTFTFGSEPDVAIRDKSKALVSTLEVKYGLDPAGALERYGAAKKSFDAATRENPKVHNIYLASCLTPEVIHRINDDRLVNEDFNLVEVLGDAEEREKFLRRIEHLTNL
jgi:hypothetical protein